MTNKVIDLFVEILHDVRHDIHVFYVPYAFGPAKIPFRGEVIIDNGYIGVVYAAVIVEIGFLHQGDVVSQGPELFPFHKMRDVVYGIPVFRGNYSVAVYVAFVEHADRVLYVAQVAVVNRSVTVQVRHPKLSGRDVQTQVSERIRQFVYVILGDKPVAGNVDVIVHYREKFVLLFFAHQSVAVSIRLGKCVCPEYPFELHVIDYFSHLLDVGDIQPAVAVHVLDALEGHVYKIHVVLGYIAVPVYVRVGHSVYRHAVA